MGLYEATQEGIRLMFGDDDVPRGLAEILLEDFSLEELLEMNNLTHEELIAHLLETGFLSEPHGYIEDYETNEEEN